MRFVSDGPIIPQSLLELRDSGEVVFFCGAGVSIPAGFPSFLRLTELIIQGLDAAKDGREHRLLPHGFERLLNVIGEGPISISQSPTFQRLRALAAATR